MISRPAMSPAANNATQNAQLLATGQATLCTPLSTMNNPAMASRPNNEKPSPSSISSSIDAALDAISAPTPPAANMPAYNCAWKLSMGQGQNTAACAGKKVNAMPYSSDSMPTAISSQRSTGDMVVALAGGSLRYFHQW